MNLFCAVGNIGQEPKIKETAGGFAVAEFSLATRAKKKEGDKYVDDTDWIPVKAFGKTAELIDKYLGKGSKVGVTGKFKTDSWEDKEGNKRYKSYIVCNELEFLDSKKSAESKPKDILEDDNIPF